MPDEASATLGTALLVRARNAIGSEFGEAAQAEPEHPALAQPGATFVTLMLDGCLRGCIGSLEAWRPLDADVRENARAAAFRDPRFNPLPHDDFARARVEVSLLTPPVELHFSDEADALRQLRPNIDGVIFECHGKRGTFLPQVWEGLPEPSQFFNHLKQKAGFATDFWSPEVKLYRYEVQKWKENERN
ncbi:MAG: AmmeMemoRadiSam system protein A [Gammaproteobacteria bacterium]|nr:AmmeMemoRadiSam system protein A [Rhodocyclaceae bacterium]MBU3909797.1 AmmeMemoRadiSam system protein A [Gammaproteobacteria bacterium]MBU3988459.1 AmmeMemoRadiSam system protein A [Gammaproteobacteria bacterium]MBU4005330.1 AmmeMemoRadiSam system protein A [Gammaproteobacteria bacterium]MBU4022508.1 AmmeMemoRadiSam system protein A [Gammaproteobacteria bacterium]